MAEKINGFTEDERKILIECGYIKFKRAMDGSIIGLYGYLFSLGLQNDIEISEIFNEYKDRYCYPIDTPEQIMLAVNAFESWDGVSEPKAGWVKYKGRSGERYPANYDGIIN